MVEAGELNFQQALKTRNQCQLQALSRTQPGLPCVPGHCATRTHDYKRHGTTTLFAAMNVHSGAM